MALFFPERAGRGHFCFGGRAGEIGFSARNRGPGTEPKYFSPTTRIGVGAALALLALAAAALLRLLPSAAACSDQPPASWIWQGE